jgi:hypothetical protein
VKAPSPAFHDGSISTRKRAFLIVAKIERES